MVVPIYNVLSTASIGIQTLCYLVTSDNVVFAFGMALGFFFKKFRVGPNFVGSVGLPQPDIFFLLALERWTDVGIV